MNQPIFLWLSVLAASAAPLNTYALINSKRSLSIDDSKRFVLTDAKYAKALGSQHLLIHEATNTVLLHLSAAQREELSRIAHEENGACGGYELLAEPATNTEDKSFGLALSSAKRESLNTFATFERQEQKDQAFRKRARLSSGIGIGLPSDPSLTRDPIVDAAINEVKEENIKATVQFLSSHPTRNHKSSDGQNAVLAFKREIERVLKGGKNAWTLDLMPHKSTPMNSLRLTIPGSLASNEIIVAGGHIDSIAQSFFGGGKKAPGADDNASGSANLLEAARILVHHQQPGKTVEIYWYAGEEGGLLGSAEIAADAKSNGKNVIGVLQLDMTLYPGDGEFKIGSMTDFTSQSMRDHLVTINSTYQIGGTIIEDKCGYGCSDHASWYKNGFPTLMPFEATKRRMNSNIHTERDVINAQSSFRHSAMFTKIAVAFLLTL
jgi:hypothetical protein